MGCRYRCCSNLTPGLPRTKLGDLKLTPLALVGGRIGDVVVHGVAQQRLRFDEDTAELTRFEATLRLDAREQRFVVQMPVAEISPKHEARDHPSMLHRIAF